MWKLSSIIALCLLAAGCAPAAQTAAGGAPPQPVCHDFTAPVTVGGAPQQAKGRACEQPDGSWQISQSIPGVPELTYTVRPPPSAPPPDQSGCRTSSFPVNVGGQPQQATVRACPLPDGSWQVTQTTPGLPEQVYTLPAAPPAPYPPLAYWGPWEPWGFGVGGFVVLRRFHHFHEFAHGGHFAHAHAGGGHHKF